MITIIIFIAINPSLNLATSIEMFPMRGLADLFC